MSFFFSHVPSVEANFSTSSTSGATGNDIVIVSQDIWEALSFVGSGESRKIVSIRAKHRHSTSSLSGHFNALTCWATCDPNVPEIVVPSVWLVTYPTIFHPFHTSLDGNAKSIVLSAVENVTLAEVVLTAKDQVAYAVASVHRNALEDWLIESHVIIRDGEDIFIPPRAFPTQSLLLQPLSLYGYRANLTLPHKQGIASRGSTRFVVTSSYDSFEVNEVNQVNRESMEINESFLISSVLSTPAPLSRAKETGENITRFLDERGFHASIVELSEAIFSAKALQSPVDLDLDQVTIYICASDLGILGVLNGDWVLASPVDCSSYRLVRISALDGTFDGSHGRSAMLSPILLHNLCPRGTRHVLLRASPYGNRDPVVPVAKSIELARVSSPFSTHRRYEPLLIDALHDYFGSSKRLHKSGDIVSLCINLDHPLDSHRVLRSGDFTNNAMHSCSNVPVYFLVRNLDHEPEPEATQRHKEPYPAPYVGCFIDVIVTKVVQVGLEHAGIPDVYDYHELCGAGVALPMAISDQVSQLLNAMSLNSAVSLGVWPTVFVTGSRGAGKFSVAVHMARRLQMHVVEINCFHVLSEALLQEQMAHAISCSPSLIVLRHVNVLGHSGPEMDGKAGPFILQTLQQCIDNAKNGQGWQCILLGTVEQSKIPEGISFSNELEIKALSEEERFYLLSRQVDYQDGLLASDVSIPALAKQTAALIALDLADLVRQTCLSAFKQLEQVLTHPMLSTAQFEAALLKARTTFSQNIGAPSIPSVFWDDVGGLSLVKNEILDTVQLPLDHPELFQDGLKKRSGVLLYGPPGTGKTLLAKAMATSCSLNFFSVKGPELLNMYIGESEANVRQVFQKAQNARPCVIFFDELDSIAPKRGNQGDSGGVMDRIVSQLLAEVDGMNMGSMDVFVVGATNRPDLLDPALLRPGRFDRMLYLGVCETHEAQLDILKALTRRFNLDSNLDLALVAALCPFNYTGADFYALCADALLHALSSKVAELDKERVKLNALPKYQRHPISPQFFISEMKSQTDLQLVVKQEDFSHALNELVPSISNAELLHYKSIQKKWHC